MHLDACKVTGFSFFFSGSGTEFWKRGNKGDWKNQRCVFSSTKIYRKIKFQSKVIK